jgi:hypothetical protein
MSSASLGFYYTPRSSVETTSFYLAFFVSLDQAGILNDALWISLVTYQTYPRSFEVELGYIT